MGVKLVRPRMRSRGNTQMLSAERLLGLGGNVGKVCPIRADIRVLMRHDQIMLRVHGHLYVVANNAR